MTDVGGSVERQGSTERQLTHQTIDYMLTRREPEPRFNHQIGWSEDYEGLFEGKYESVTDIEIVINAARRWGRVLLSGRAGAAKSTIILRLMRLALNNPMMIPVLIDLKSWQTEDYSQWNALPNNWSSRLNMLLERFAHPSADLTTLDALDPAISRLVFIDGLNEVLAPVAQEIFAVADNLAEKGIRTSVVVSDRVVRRELRNMSKWRFASVQPLTNQEIFRVLHACGIALTPPVDNVKLISLLETPFFLNQYLRFSTAGALLSTVSTKAAALAKVFEQTAKLTADEFSCVAEAALKVLKTDQSRTFSLYQFRHFAGESAVSKLLHTQVLRGTPEASYFGHHLYHDYLAATCVARNKNLWHRDAFDTLTFDASSFDALAMAIEQISSTNEADLFVRRLYDWNAYSAAYSVAEATQTTSPISDYMIFIILSMLAEKRWDIMRGTAQRAEDALHLFPKYLQNDFSAAESLQSLFEVVARQEYSAPDFEAWKKLFTKSASERATDSEVALIENDDSITGWTVANVLKRCKVTPKQQEQLRALSNSVSPTVRWRTAHALGSHPNMTNVVFLTNLIEQDKDGWVRYGAVRSLVEIAALGTPAVRLRVFSAIRKRIMTQSFAPKVLGELRRALLIRPDKAPPNWAPQALTIIEALYEQAESLKERMKLEEQAQLLKREYEHAPHPETKPA